MLFLFTDEKVLFIYPSRNRYVEKSHHHFVMGLFAPPHFGIRIRIVRIRRPRWLASSSLLFRALHREIEPGHIQSSMVKNPTWPARTIVFETRGYISYNLSLSTDVGDSSDGWRKR